jgi:hypothetical protein
VRAIPKIGGLGSRGNQVWPHMSPRYEPIPNVKHVKVVHKVVLAMVWGKIKNKK